jgi:hypothetical protein
MLANAFRDFGVLVALYENRKSCLTFLFSINLSVFLFGYHKYGIYEASIIEFSSNLCLVWIKIKIFEISSDILYVKMALSRISRDAA